MNRHSTGVLLVNLGTTASPTAAGVRAFLKTFLQDSRVIEIPKLFWLPLLYGIILPIRSPKVAKKYAGIWGERGSPMAFNTADIAEGLKQALHCPIAVGYRYSEPSLQQGLSELMDAGCRNIIVLPLYPQFSATTTSTVFDQIADIYRDQRAMPSLQFIADYHDHADYIAALAQSIRQHWDAKGRSERLLMSFHGLPERNVKLGDPYLEQCQTTARLLSEVLELKDGEWSLSFQSRFGAQKWLQPYTEPLLEEWAQAGLKSVDVLCPGFAADCLETLEEIRLEAAEAFIEAGGKQLNYIPALNAAPDHIDALAKLVRGAMNPI